MNYNKKILVVEDEVPLMNALNDKLTKEGFTVLQAKNGEEGLDIALIEKPDLILADILMPKMDGLVMLKKIRESEEGKKIKFIILTNVNSSEKIAEAMDLQEVITDGSFEYFIKASIKLEDIVKKIKEKLQIV